MIGRGLWLLVRGKTSGVNEFPSTVDGFSASLAPLIAFPLVGAALAAMNGDWADGATSFISRLCAVCMLPLIIHAVAKRSGREQMWLRTATILNWSFWVLVPLLVISVLLASFGISFGIPAEHAEILVLVLIGLYVLWLHWFIIKSGLEMSKWQAFGVLLVASLCTGLLSIGPILIDYAWRAIFHVSSA